MDQHIPHALTVLHDIKKASGECLQHIRGLSTKLKGETPTAQGISFLDVKNQLMSSYMSNLGLLMDKKTSGKTIRDDPSIDRLVEIRTVLEKMRPIEHKLRYQINKVVSAYKEGKFDPSDPRKFKPNFGAFANTSKDDSSDEEGQSQGQRDSKPTAYVAPKLAPVHYSDDETTEERQKKLAEKQKRKAIGSAMLKEMREQFTDAPTEVVESRDLHRFRENKKMKERTEYEESNFMRLPTSKKEAAGMNKMGTMSALGAIADFDDLTGADGYSKGGPAAKKRKTSSKKKGKGKKSGKKGGKRRWK